MSSPTSTSPLPEGWSELEAVEDRVVADGVALRRAGLASRGPDGEEITGSAADVAECPAARSYFELLERAATLEALRSVAARYVLRTRSGEEGGAADGAAVFPESGEPARWRYARSNGVALYAGWSGACDRALWELCERDRVLRAWYGETLPYPVAARVEGSALAEARSYAWEAHGFPAAASDAWSGGLVAVGVFGFPTHPEAPLVLGYAARPTEALAIAAAQREALQQLAFLWGETIPSSEPAVGPSALHHLERTLWPGQHAVLRRWLAGGHRDLGGRAAGAPRLSASVGFVDLTPAWLGGDLRVAKAVCPAAAPLAFGEAPFAAHLPRELRLHPVA